MKDNLTGYTLSEALLNTYQAEIHHESPEENLWLQCLIEGIQAALDPSFESHADDKFWLFSSCEEDVGSFDWICDHLGFDPDALRVRIWKHQRKINLKGLRVCYHSRGIQVN